MNNFANAPALQERNAEQYLLEAQRMRAAYLRAFFSRLFARSQKSDTTSSDGAAPAAA